MDESDGDERHPEERDDPEFHFHGFLAGKRASVLWVRNLAMRTLLRQGIVHAASIEDQAHEVVIALVGRFRRNPELDDPKTFGGYVVMAARSAGNSFFRTRKRGWDPSAQAEFDEIRIADPSTPFVNRAADAELIEAGLARLTEGERAVVVPYLSGSKLREIAEDLGISPGAAKARWERAQRKLQSHLTRHLDGGNHD